MKTRGFTLLEVLVALAILALALMAALRAGSVAAQNEGEIRARQLADWVALDRLEEYRARRVWLPVGSNTAEAVQGGMRFRLEEKISGTPNAQFRRIDIHVFSAEVNNATNAGALSRFTSFLVKPGG
jgi:general secretion pathway protein I